MHGPEKQLCIALNALQRMQALELLSASPVYRTPPLGGIEQSDYLNAVIKMSTTLSPWQLLRQLQNQEKLQGRIRRQHWGPRTLDLDILLVGQRQQKDLLLELPHPGIYMRRFVLKPLVDIEPNLTFPDGSLIAKRLEECPSPPIQLEPVDEFKLP